MLHIDLAKWADIILVAPATAEFYVKTYTEEQMTCLQQQVLHSTKKLFYLQA